MTSGNKRTLNSAFFSCNIFGGETEKQGFQIEVLSNRWLKAITCQDMNAALDYAHVS